MSVWFGRAGGGVQPDDRPSVRLITDESFGESEARAVASGCEEEGVPLAWDAESGSSAELARSACLRSRLETGIGIGSDRRGAIALVSVPDAPYLERDADTPSRLRWLGQTAARLSKGEPIVYETEGTDEHE
ncbi:MAG: glycerol dehydratase reactivase beta/small subunit family protein [Synergistaceae bacterium]|nr:glycerol dehydratase reactivase beta/small subunit family protein [Synergistaceae bacterium]